MISATRSRTHGLLLLSAIASVATHATEPVWKEVAFQGNHIVFLDASSIKVRDRYLTAWVMRNYATPQTDAASRKDYTSVIELQAFDCGAEKISLLDQTLYEGSRGSGAVVRSTDYNTKQEVSWSYVIPGSIGATTLTAVCNRSSRKPATRSPNRQPAAKSTTTQI
jgi:hypothetical protein